MDDRRFDGLAKALASGSNRRTLLKGILGSGGATVGAFGLSGRSSQAARRPTPTPRPVSCPGQQIWNGAMCVCPSGIACGPDCCGTAAQCCDNACCPDGTICIGEEFCCPQSQMCGGACCDATQDCCVVDGCCDGLCVSSGTCCTTGNICSATNGDACCAPWEDCCSAGDPICIDRSAGGCCGDSDCAGLTDACNTGVCNPLTNLCDAQPVSDGTGCGDCAICRTGICETCDAPYECCDDSTCVDPTNDGCCSDSDCTELTDACNTGICDGSTHRCIAEPVADGTSCGTCVTCTGGVCPDACESPLRCCEETICVDPQNGGCCENTDCPTSTDACFSYSCEENQCVEVDVITCPSGQECLDGQCACPGGKEVCDTGGAGTCCAADETCHELAPVSGYSVCCQDGTPACFDPSFEAVCCDGNQSCQPLAGPTSSIEICCEGEVCGSPAGPFCCSPGQVCTPIEGNRLPSICCHEGRAACFDGQVSFCCGAGETCMQGICCANEICQDTDGQTVCCAEGSTCQPFETPFETFDLCCPGEPCLDDIGNLICCDTGETCQAITIVAPVTVLACCSGELCYTGNGPDGVECCAAGEACKTYAVVNGIPLGICCASDVEACFGEESTPVCCGEDGFTCQPLWLPETQPIAVCCEGPPCFGLSGTECCAVDEVCAPFAEREPLGVCCDAGSNACIFTPAGGSEDVGTCCTESQLCHPTQGCVDPA